MVKSTGGHIYSMDTRTASRPFYETVLRFARFTFREMNRGGRERERKGEEGREIG